MHRHRSCSGQDPSCRIINIKDHEIFQFLSFLCSSMMSRDWIMRLGFLRSLEGCRMGMLPGAILLLSETRRIEMSSSLSRRRSRQSWKQQRVMTSSVREQLAQRISPTILTKNTAKGITVKSLLTHFIKVRLSALRYILQNMVLRMLSISLICPLWMRMVTCLMCSMRAPMMKMKNSFTSMSGTCRSHCEIWNRMMYRLFCNRSLASKLICPRQALESNFLKALLFILVRLVTKQKMMKFCMDPLITTMQMLNSRKMKQAWATVQIKQAAISGSSRHDSTARLSSLFFTFVQRYLPSMVQIFSPTSMAKINPYSFSVDCPRNRWYIQDASSRWYWCCWNRQQATSVITEKYAMWREQQM